MDSAGVPASLVQGALSALQRDILRILVYFDMFDHPLRLAEIYHFLPTDTADPADLHYACLCMLLNGHLEEQDGFFTVVGRSEQIVDLRMQKERRARHMWIFARFIASLISRFPFVRGVFISGELSKGVASKGSDIDFYIVTAQRRVWIVRTFCTAFKIIFLFDRRRFFCYNHITSEERLDLDERNFYTAVEAVTLKPLYNLALYEKFRFLNSWTREYVPNADYSPAEGERVIPPLSSFERILCAIVPSTLLDRLDHWLLDRWRILWGRRYPELREDKRVQLFQCTPQLSTAYAGDFLERILFQYERRLSQYGLTPQR